MEFSKNFTPAQTVGSGYLDAFPEVCRRAPKLFGGWLSVLEIGTALIGHFSRFENYVHGNIASALTEPDTFFSAGK